jgi:serine/threonine-protein kinase HipA
MNRCPITYKSIEGANKYSQTGLGWLSPGLKTLNDFPYSAQEQLELAIQHATKLSIQGVQPKLSVKLNSSKSIFEIVDLGGTFILKPPHHIFQELPQNEDLTMRLASVAGIRVPLHGMVYATDGSLTYFIKRFDRLPNGQKLAVEDFSQLLGYSRDTKYDSSMEKIVPIFDKHCTFPMIEKLEFLRLAIFNFLVGNEDMHLKNFSLIRQKNRVQLSPAYDLLNSSMVMKNSEEIALPLRGKKSNLKREDFVEYLAMERLGLVEEAVKEVLELFQNSVSVWQTLISCSFLSDEKKQSYLKTLKNRWDRLGIKN